MYMYDSAIKKREKDRDDGRRIKKKKNKEDGNRDEKNITAAKFLCTCLTIPTYVN